MVERGIVENGRGKKGRENEKNDERLVCSVKEIYVKQ